MRLLLIKTSSMGDIIHTLPALSDAQKAIPDLKIDWVIENDFAEIPKWHPSVDRILPIYFRQWRKNFLTQKTWREWQALKNNLQSFNYDLVIDAQTLLKSAWLTLFIKTKQKIGLDWYSARESMASLFYNKKLKINFYQHAISRMRQMFSLALNYELSETAPDFGINVYPHPHKKTNPYLVFLHGTTWFSKEWPELYWIQLAKLAYLEGFNVVLSGGDETQIARAFRIAQESENVTVLPKLTIDAMKQLLIDSDGAIAVDTGFGHLASALNIPTLSLYGPTNPLFTGAIGNYTTNLKSDSQCSPCYGNRCPLNDEHALCMLKMTPQVIWNHFKKLLLKKKV